jgi:adenosylcobinamide-GDP ribazoletransferase
VRRAGPADGLRLAVGTLTVVRVRPPTKVDRAVAGRAMLWAAPVGLLLGAAAGLVLEGARAASHHSVAGVFLASVLAIATLAVLTRGRHLDGLADTADALASGRPAPAALEIMRRGDVGPVGVVTLLLVLGVQVFAVAESVGRGNGWLCLVVAVLTGRIALTWGCTTHVPAARFTGLGAAVAGTLRVRTPFVVTALGALLAAAISALDDDRGISLALRSAAAVVAGVAGSLLLLQRCVARFGGVTGDVLGALVECATTMALLCFSLL